MLIAINTRFLLPGQLEGYGHFLQQALDGITRSHPEHRFLFIFDRPIDSSLSFASNVTPIVVGPPARHPLLWKWWYDVKIPAVLRKWKTDLFVSCDGFCSLRTKTPQCLVLHDLAFAHFPDHIPRLQLRYYRRYTGRFIEKAASIATVSEFSRTDILDHYPQSAGKVNVVYNGVRENFKPMDEGEKNDVRLNLTDGRNYFLYVGSIHPRKNLMQLLRAFSIFKKRQKSDWKLVLAGRLAWNYDNFLAQLQSYRYREDVVMTGYLDDQQLARVTAAAYAMVYPSIWEGFGVPVLEAMQSAVPVVTTENSAMQEIAGEAALYAPADDHAAIAEQMMLLYKDEQLRSGLIEKGIQRAKHFTWQRTQDELWKCMMKATRLNTGS